MPRRRKPTRILELTGALKHDKKRYASRANEPIENAPLGGPPDRLPPTEREVWEELRAILVEGVALRSDAPAFESLVRLVVKDRACELGTRGQALLLSLLGRFGMTPSDRSRVSAPAPAGAGNPFGGLGRG